MSENPDGLSVVLALNPVVQLLIRIRNSESLKRLEELALVHGQRRERRTAAG